MHLIHMSRSGDAGDHLEVGVFAEQLRPGADRDRGDQAVGEVRGVSPRLRHSR